MKYVVAMTTALFCWSGVAFADEAPNREASEHFRRGVSLFNEADYRGASVEFKKAYQIAPSPAVFYNIGQSAYQLRDYANALGNFERYLAEGTPSGARRDEVLSAIETLRTRVGRLKISTKATDVEVSIDDEVIGKASNTAILVSIGRRRIALTHKGSAARVQNVEIAAGETATIEFEPQEPGKTTVLAATAVTKPPVAEPVNSYTPAIIGFAAAGLLGSAAGITGILALSAKSDLDEERSRAGALRSKLDSADDRRSSMALVSDVFLGSAAIAAGVGVYFLVSPPKSSTSNALRIRPMATPTFAATYLEGRF